jgi:hypothetical protein
MFWRQLFSVWQLLKVTGSNQPFGLQSRLNTLKTATPYSPSSERGAQFCCRVCQGCKNSAGIKSLGENAYGNKKMFYSQKNPSLKL